MGHPRPFILLREDHQESRAESSSCQERTRPFSFYLWSRVCPCLVLLGSTLSVQQAVTNIFLTRKDLLDFTKSKS